MSRFSNVFDSEPKTEQIPELEVQEVKIQEVIAPAVDHFEDDKQKYGSTDPRSDKSVDHKYWLDLLWNAWYMDKSLSSIYYTLHGIRCGGGELTLTSDSFRLLQGEWSVKDWDAVKRENLGPIKDRLVKILRITRVGKVLEDELPVGWFDEGMGEKAPEAGVAEAEQERMFKV